MWREIWSFSPAALKNHHSPTRQPRPPRQPATPGSTFYTLSPKEQAAASSYLLPQRSALSAQRRNFPFRYRGSGYITTAWELRLCGALRSAGLCALRFGAIDLSLPGSPARPLASVPSAQRPLGAHYVASRASSALYTGSVTRIPYPAFPF